LLGAAALGVIGKLFPDNDPALKDADSLVLLRRVGTRLRSAGYRPTNIDATVIAQAPKLAPHIPEMRRRIAMALNMDISEVSVKATTEEGLGFTGEKLGISAHAVCLLEE
jgi:2-C-methyl-D-erythritol 2,4-cyclodiphosphate synthase